MTVALLAAALTGVLPEQVLFGWLVVQVGIVLQGAPLGEPDHQPRRSRGRTISELFRQLIADDRARSFTAPRLQALHDASGRCGRPSIGASSPGCSGSSRSSNSASTTRTHA